MLLQSQASVVEVLLIFVNIEHDLVNNTFSIAIVPWHLQIWIHFIVAQ